MIRRALVAFLFCLLALSQQVVAQEKVTLGWARLLNNDLLGDLQDRWHSGSYTVSVLRGPRWMGTAPRDFGSLLEYRFWGATLTPANLDDPAADDRPYAAPLSLGLHTHLAHGGLQGSFGVDLVATGPQTGVGRFQSWLHGVLGVPKPDLTKQIGNRFFPTLQAELGRDVALGSHSTLHPFVAAQAGVENLVRVGGDIVVGSFGQGGLLLRDDTTGQRYRGIDGQPEGSALSLTLGGDVAHVFQSNFLPDGSVVAATQTRSRLRAGLSWQGAASSVFYGVTYLAPEFETQPQGQVVGSVNLDFRF